MAGDQIEEESPPILNRGRFGYTVSPADSVSGRGMRDRSSLGSGEDVSMFSPGGLGSVPTNSHLNSGSFYLSRATSTLNNISTYVEATNISN